MMKTSKELLADFTAGKVKLHSVNDKSLASADLISADDKVAIYNVVDG